MAKTANSGKSKSSRNNAATKEAERIAQDAPKHKTESRGGG